MSIEIPEGKKKDGAEALVKKPSRMLKMAKNMMEFGAGVVISDAIKAATPKNVPDIAQDIIHMVGGGLGAAATANASKDAAQVIGGIGIGGARNLVNKLVDFIKSKFGAGLPKIAGGSTTGTQQTIATPTSGDLI
jgi:hypothetical protein